MKHALFAAALLPQFIDASRPTLPQFGVLVATFAVIEVSWYLVYAGFGANEGPRVVRGSDRRVWRVGHPYRRWDPYRLQRRVHECRGARRGREPPERSG